MKPGIELIAAERERQIKEEGWTAGHDDEHTDGSLADAAAVYAMGGTTRNMMARGGVCIAVAIWPRGWNLNWFKPSCDTAEGRIRELSKAGALIAAEIDRIQRANSQLS